MNTPTNIERTSLGLLQCDPHRRARDENYANSALAHRDQQTANRREWERRAIEAIKTGNYQLAHNLINQAEATK